MTKIGDDNWIMATCHIAHDCIVGNRTIFANGASLAGHAVIEDDVILGGYSMIYQRCRVGEGAITGFSSGIHRSVPPFVTAAGYRAVPSGINSEGLRRRGFSPEAIKATKMPIKRFIGKIYLFRMQLFASKCLQKMHRILKRW